MPRLLCATTKSGRRKRTLEVFDGLGALAQALQGRTQIAQRFRIVGPDLKARPGSSRRHAQNRSAPVRFREIGMIDVRIGPDRHGPADQLDRPGVIALLVKKHAQEVKRLGVFLLPRQHTLIQLRSRSQLTRAVHLDRSRQHVLHGRATIPKSAFRTSTDTPREAGPTAAPRRDATRCDLLSIYHDMGRGQNTRRTHAKCGGSKNCAWPDGPRSAQAILRPHSVLINPVDGVGAPGPFADDARTVVIVGLGRISHR